MLHMLAHNASKSRSWLAATGRDQSRLGTGDPTLGTSTKMPDPEVGGLFARVGRNGIGSKLLSKI